MGDQEDGTGELIEGGHEGLAGLDFQVVSGFVEEQDIGAGNEDLGEGCLGAFAEAELGDGDVGVFAGKL